MDNNSNTPAAGVAVTAVFIALDLVSRFTRFVFASIRYVGSDYSQMVSLKF